MKGKGGVLLLIHLGVVGYVVMGVGGLSRRDPPDSHTHNRVPHSVHKPEPSSVDQVNLPSFHHSPSLSHHSISQETVPIIPVPNPAVFQKEKRTKNHQKRASHERRREDRFEIEEEEEEERAREEERREEDLIAKKFQAEAKEIIKNITSEVEGRNTTGGAKSLLQVYKEIKALRAWIEKPYVHGVVLPAFVGVVAALITVSTVCCIQSCVRGAARRRRKVRIRHLSNDLKNDRAVLLDDENSDEDF